MKHFIILAGASWAWKDTVKIELEQKFNLKNLISTTSRKKRKGEIDGIHYNFISEDDFKNNLDDFLEYSRFSWNFYWKRKIDLDKLIKNNKNIITILETNGVKNIYNNKSFLERQWYKLTIFFLDISENEIKNRMLSRWDNIEDVKKRLKDWNYTLFQQIKNYADYSIDADISQDKVLSKISNIIQKLLLNKKN